jgi:glycosyltransferase involved in cell wall biosynthesis
MIIGQFSEAFPPINDGVAQVIKNYAHWLTEKNDECYVVIPELPNVSNDYDFDILTFRSNAILFKKEYRTGFPKWDKAFYDKIRSIDFDIMHSHSPFSSGKLGIDLAGQKGIPSVITFHTKFRDVIKNIAKSDLLTDIILKRIMRWFNMADDVWTVSGACREILRQYGYKGEIYVVENGCDFDADGTPERAAETVNELFGIPERLPVLTFVGRMEYYKNIKTIIEALKIVRGRGYDFRMLFVGFGNKKHRFEEMVESCGLGPKTTFTGNINDRQLLKKIYLRSSAVLFPSVSDMSSLVIKEAAAMACPVVLVKGSTTSEGIKDGVNGFLIENSALSLAEKTEMILNNPSAAAAAGAGARETLYKSWEQIAGQARERYLYLIDKKKIAGKR